MITKSLLKSSFPMSFVDWSPTVSANSVSFACISVNEYLLILRISLLTARFTLVYLIVPLTQLIQSPKGVPYCAE